MAKARIGDTVKVHYEGRLEDGTVFASSIDGDPAEVTIGARMVIPAFEEAIIGMDPGDSKTVTIPEEAAFGPRRGELVQTIDREGLAAGLQPEVGQRLQAVDAEGRSIHAVIRDISDQTVTIDANHPLAGQDLNFEIELVGIV
ncbi:MAG: peptidylprolyl isomerase [Sedimentisphaerales bacterium]|nr:peptidylprolyl isomerase [Sedimentisphaerales bacterium]